MNPVHLEVLKEKLPEFDYLSDDDWAAFYRFADINSVIGEIIWSHPDMAKISTNEEQEERTAAMLLDKEDLYKSLSAYYGEPV